MLRHMLVHEDGDDLHLLAAVPDWWLAPGEEIRLDRLPTHFGEMSLLIRGTAAGVSVTYVAPKREAPKNVILHLPKSRQLVTAIPGVKVVTRADQKQRWDFPTIVKKYEELARH